MNDADSIATLETGKTTKNASEETQPIKYPIKRTLLALTEHWMAYCFALAIIAVVALRLFHAVSTSWIFLAPFAVYLLLVAVRYPSNRRHLKQLKQDFIDARQQEARFRELVPSAREAVMELRGVKREIYRSGALSGQKLSHILSRLNEYEGDYIDLLYLYQERLKVLRAIMGRDLSTASAAIAREKEQAEQSADKSSQLYKRKMDALVQQESLISKQALVGKELKESLDLIRIQARNIWTLFDLVRAQVNALPIGVKWTDNFQEFESLSDSIQMTKETLNASSLY